MDEIIKVLLPQAPMTVVLLFAVQQLYVDAKIERALMRSQLLALARVITLLAVAVNAMADKMGTPKVDIAELFDAENVIDADKGKSPKV
jgi:hypothetical protein